MRMRTAILAAAALLSAGSVFAAGEAVRIEERIRELEKRLARQDAQAEESKRRIAEIGKEVAERRAAVESLEGIRRKNVNDEQVEKLRRATKAQGDLAERIALLRKILEEDQPEPEKLVAENRGENALVEKDASALAMVDAFEMAKEIESAITESYKDIKATQTAIERRMSFDAARKITDVAKAVRIEADRQAIEDSPRTKDALDVQKAAQAEVVRETESIVDTALSMMQEAMEIVLPDDPSAASANATKPKDLAWLKPEDFEKRTQDEALKERLELMAAAADFQVAITAAAAENEDVRAKDLTRIIENTA